MMISETGSGGSGEKRIRPSIRTSKNEAPSKIIATFPKEKTELPKVPYHVREYEAPFRLKPGENLYNQAPFNIIINDAITTSGLKPEDIQSGLSRMLNKIKDQTPDEKNATTARYRNSRYYIETELFSPSHSRHGVKAGALRTVLQGLEKFPKWFEYLDLIRKEFKYKANGEYSPVIDQTEQPLSYFSWLQNQQKMERRLQELDVHRVLQEAFPEQSTTGSISTSEDRREMMGKWTLRGVKGRTK